MGVFASQSPGFYDDLLLIDSTPVECARSRETVKRSAARRRRRLRLLPLATPATSGGSGCTRSSRRTAPPERSQLASPKTDEREVGLELLDRARRHGGETLLGDKGYAGREFAAKVSERDATIVRPAAKTSPATGRTSRRSANASRASSGPAKTSSPSNATAPAPSPASANASSHRFCCLAAAITLNHQLGRPSRALVNYCA